MGNIFTSALNSIKNIWWVPTSTTPTIPVTNENLDTSTPIYNRSMGGSVLMNENLNN